MWTSVSPRPRHDVEDDHLHDAKAEPEVRPAVRGFHSSTFQLNVSTFCPM